MYEILFVKTIESNFVSLTKWRRKKTLQNKLNLFNFFLYRIWIKSIYLWFCTVYLKSKHTKQLSPFLKQIFFQAIPKKTEYNSTTKKTVRSHRINKPTNFSLPMQFFALFTFIGKNVATSNMKLNGTVGIWKCLKFNWCRMHLRLFACQFETDANILTIYLQYWREMERRKKRVNVSIDTQLQHIDWNALRTRSSYAIWNVCKELQEIVFSWHAIAINLPRTLSPVVGEFVCCLLPIWLYLQTQRFHHWKLRVYISEPVQIKCLLITFAKFPKSVIESNWISNNDTQWSTFSAIYMWYIMIGGYFQFSVFTIRLIFFCWTA